MYDNNTGKLFTPSHSAKGAKNPKRTKRTKGKKGKKVCVEKKFVLTPLVCVEKTDILGKTDIRDIGYRNDKAPPARYGREALSRY